MANKPAPWASSQKKLSEDGSKTADAFIPQLNVHPYLDAFVGSYQKGLNGEMILDGGLMNLVAIGGEGNVGKSTIINCFALSAMSHHPSLYLSTYDTENSFKTMRMAKLAERYPGLEQEDWASGEGRYQLFSTVTHSGDQWHHDLRQFCKEKEKDKRQVATTPFLDLKKKDGKPMKSYYPSIFILDSLSKFHSGTIIDKLDKNEIDDKENNNIYMQDGLQKTKLLDELSNTLPRSNTFVLTTMHVGEEINMTNQPLRKKLGHMRQGSKFKNVPKNVEFLTNHCWDVMRAAPLFNNDRSAVYYPIKGLDGSLAKTDLMEVTVQGLRNKSGPSGVPFTLLVSQSSGVLWGLSCYHYLTRFNYGVESPRSNFYTLAFYPDVTLGRTTVREMIDNDPKLDRALALMAEIAVCIMYRDEFPSKYRLKLNEIYEKIKERGYDWNKLLDTRGYWLYKEEEEHLGDSVKPYLCGLDIIRMAIGEHDDPRFKA